MSIIEQNPHYLRILRVISDLSSNEWISSTRIELLKQEDLTDGEVHEVVR